LFPIFGVIAFGPGGLTPLGVGWWRLVLGALVLSTLAAVIYRRAALPRRRDVGRLILAGWLGVALNQGLYLLGLARSTPMNSALVTCLIPVFTFVLAAGTGLERFNGMRLTGILIALTGTLPLLFENGLSGLGRHGLGNLLMVSNAFVYSMYLIIAKPLLRKYPPLVLIAWSYVASLPFALWFLRTERLVPGQGHPAVWWSLAFIIAFPTILGYVFNTFALSRMQASSTAVYIYAQPLVTGLASWAVFGETPTPQMLLAALALFAGIWLVSVRRTS
jgi:drug/metabolite transporter (DMT)-like permease